MLTDLPPLDSEEIWQPLIGRTLFFCLYYKYIRPLNMSIEKNH
jgi:hypothetical protein